MRFQPTAVFLLCVLALAAFPAAAFGVTPETIGLGFVTAAAATFLVDRAPGAFRPSMMFQRGDIGAQLDEVAAQYEKVQADLTQVGQQLKNHADGVRAEIQTIEQRIAQHFQNGGGVIRGGDGVASVIMGEFAESPAFAHLQEGNAGSARVKFNGGIQAALLTDGMGTSSDGSLPRDPARLGFVPETLRPLRLLDVLPVIPTQRDSVEYTRLSSEGEASEQVQEGDEKAEIEFDGELIRNEIVTIAAHTTASKQVLSDHGQLQAAIDMVLRHKARARLENKIINGPGGSGQIHGLIDLATVFVPTIAATLVDQIGEAIYSREDEGYEPSLVVMNPLDWFGIVTTKSETEGLYIFGNPLNPIRASIWERPVVLTSSVPKDSTLVLDTRHVAVLDREQASVMVSTSHKDYFTRNLVAILAELRAQLMVADLGGVILVDSSSSE